ncbi:MAG: hypothetical protein COB07_01085 [Sulfurovum sp.]|nr:MAG: hypothetical protein COB07_01085 [Sulfurovum sp.]
MTYIVQRKNVYNLNFISDENLFSHVKETVEKYRFTIDLKKFNKKEPLLVHGTACGRGSLS